MSYDSSMQLWVIVTMLVAFVLGIVFLLGKGDRLIQDKNSGSRSQTYDMKKVQRGFGVAFIAIGIGAAIGLIMQNTTGYMIYICVTVIALIASCVYMTKFCKK